MATIQIDGTQLEYFEAGEGEPVVFVHGTLGDFRSWGMQMDDFAKSFRAISYSRRYHYPNQCRGDESDYSPVAHADDLAAFIAALGLDSAHIVGSSYGAYVALFLAKRHPERVRSLVVGEPPDLPLLEQNPEGRKVRDEFLATVWNPAAETVEQGHTEEGIRLFIDGVVAEGAFDQFPSEVQALILDNACEFKAEPASPEFWTPFTCDDARSVKAPTLLLTGENSLPMLKFVVDELDSCLPNKQYETIPDATHEMAADNPSAYNKTVIAFIADHAA